MKVKTSLKILEGFPNMIPFVNLFFLLLFFFLLGSSFVQVSALRIDLPVAKAQKTSVAKLVVSIDKNKRLYFNDQELNLVALQEQLGKISAKHHVDSVIIRADKETPHQIVTEVLSLASALNLNVYLALASPIGETEPYLDDKPASGKKGD